MGHVATLLPSPVRLNRLRAALRDRYSVVQCASWDELLGACGREPVSIAVVDLYTGAGEKVDGGFEWLRQLKRRYPSVALVAYVGTPPAKARDMFEAGRFGIDGLVVADQDDEPRRMLGLIEQADARGVVEMLRRSIIDVKPTVRDATLIAVTRAHERLSPETLARILGVRRKALSERLSQSGFPTAQRLIAWGRLIVAARMLEDSGRSADSVALALDFPSGSAFRNTCQRYVRSAPHQIRAGGGAHFVIAAFLDEARGVSRGEPLLVAS
ncbi:MAG: helix-turn-helix domain-containing protein [Gemmatimonadaceae bacterium]